MVFIFLATLLSIEYTCSWILYFRESKQIIKIITFLEAFTASRYVPFPGQVIFHIGVESAHISRGSRFTGKEMLQSALE